MARNPIGVTLALSIIFGALHLSIVRAQDSEPRFEVASIKPNDGCENSPRFGSLSPSPGRLELPCATLQSMIQQAYGTFADGATINPQLLRTEGGPPWMQSGHYSVSAKASGPARTEMLAGPMLRSLLEERFQLKTHRETREIPVYVMTAGRPVSKCSDWPKARALRSTWRTRRPCPNQAIPHRTSAG